MYFQNYSRHQWNVSVGQEVISEGNIHYNYSVIGNSTTAHIFSETSAYFLDYYILINTAPMNGYVLSRGQSVNLLNSEVALINLSDPYL